MAKSRPKKKQKADALDPLEAWTPPAAQDLGPVQLYMGGSSMTTTYGYGAGAWPALSYPIAAVNSTDYSASYLLSPPTRQPTRRRKPRAAPPPSPAWTIEVPVPVGARKVRVA